MADTDSSSAQKHQIDAHKNHAHVYDLLYQLNEAFVRVQRRVALLEQLGIFDPLIMQTLNRQSETLRAGANCHLLGAMRRMKNATASASRSHPLNKILNPTGPPQKEAVFCFHSAA